MSKSQGQTSGGRPDQRPVGGGTVAIELERLRRRFEGFRRSHEPGTRIPEVLRAAALAAQQRGASEGDLRRVCQATSVQLRQWRTQLERGAVKVGAAADPVARVFNVVDQPTALESTPSGEPSSAELELRLGGWAVRISQLGG